MVARSQDEDSVVVSIAAGSCHALAVVQHADKQCTVLSWGRGEDGQLGHGAGGADSRVPKVVDAMDSKSASYVLAGAEFSMVVCEEGKSVYSCGWGDFGRLGHGHGDDFNFPTQISSLMGKQVASVSCGDAHTLVVLADGKLFGFGRNQNGQIGNGTTADCFECTEVQNLHNEHVIGASCGAEHSVCVTQSGSVYAWGWGRYGNLGTDSFADEHAPQKMKGLDNKKICSAVCGWRHSVLVDSEGQLHATGWGKYGQLGTGNTENISVPVHVEMPNKQKVLLVDGGWRHTAAATQDNFYAWGWNKWGQLGIGRQGDVCVPVEVEGLQQPISLLACGWRHTLALTAIGELYSWGRNCSGQLGIGSLEDKFSPQRVACLCKGAIDLAAIKQQATDAAACEGTSAWDSFAVVPGTEDFSDKRQRVT